jgi:threonine dehydratase
MMLENIPTLKDIQDAAERLTGIAHNTPILANSTIDKLCKCKILFKCENFQKVGAFKFRGAYNAVASLPKEKLEKGVVTHSSGNHAAALTLAAKLNQTEAFIVMPNTAPELKKKAVKSYGAEITFCEPTLKSREETAQKIIDKTGAELIHPFNNYSIIAGQATAAMELINDYGKLDYILAPVGGGGLLSGTSLSANYLSPKTKVIGCEPEGADDAFCSLRDGKIYPSENPQTICDGLLTSLGEKTFNIIQKYVEDIITVDDEQIINAMRLIWERMKIIVEPSSAVPLAVVMNNKNMFEDKLIGIILSGGNVYLNKLPF